MKSSDQAAAGSVSRIALEVGVLGKSFAPCELVRHLAPTTSRSIVNSLPLQGLVHRYSDQFVYFETGLVIGAEKQRTAFKRGEMGFLVSNGSICIFLSDATLTQPMNPLGRVNEGLESTIEATKAGDVVILRNPATA